MFLTLSPTLAVLALYFDGLVLLLLPHMQAGARLVHGLYRRVAGSRDPLDSQLDVRGVRATLPPKNGSDTPPNRVFCPV